YRGAAGWGGDRALLVVRDATASAPVAVFAAWVTTWDRDGDAEDFAEQGALAVARLAGARAAEAVMPRAARADSEVRAEVRDVTGRICSVVRRGRAVVLLVGAPPDARPLAEVLLAAARRASRQRPAAAAR